MHAILQGLDGTCFNHHAIAQMQNTSNEHKPLSGYLTAEILGQAWPTT